MRAEAAAVRAVESLDWGLRDCAHAVKGIERELMRGREQKGKATGGRKAR